MEFIPSLLSSTPSFSIPQTWMGRIIAGLGWILMAALLLFLLWRVRHLNKSLNRKYWLIWIVLALATPVTSLFIGISLAGQGVLPMPGVPLEISGPVMMLFVDLPWMLAAGLLGPAGAAAIAAISGLFSGLWNTHSIFTPLEMVLLATLFSVAMMQRYRTPFFRLLRQPILAAFLLVATYPFIFIITATISSDYSLAARLDYSLSMLATTTSAVAGELIIAAAFSQVIALGFPTMWGQQGDLLPSPAERSLRVRYLLAIAPLIFVLLLTLLVGDWIMAGQAARRILKGRMQDSALIASKGIPYFLDVGQNEITKLAGDQRLYASSPADLTNILKENLIRVPFFNQFYILDSSGQALAGYPAEDYDTSLATPEEQMGIQLALQGVPYQTYTAEPQDGRKVAQVSLIAQILDDKGEAWGVLVGRTDLLENPFTAPIITSLQSMRELDGDGMLLDENGRVLYHPIASRVMSEYTGRIPDQAEFFDELQPDGTRRWVYYQPAEGRPWAVVLTVPARAVQQIALDIASPLLLIIAIVALISVVFLSLSLSRITSSLQGLANQAGIIAKGQLDEPLSVSGEDEVGQLRRSFEQMRQSLKARLDELNRLLVVVRGVAANLEMDQAVKPVLESALVSGASSARAVLDPSMVPELDSDPRKPVAYSAGEKADLYSFLDDQIMTLTRQQDRLVLNNISRPRLFRVLPHEQQPEALMAVALRHENQYYGALWIAYDQAHMFSDEEVRFVVTLAGQAALAAANARLYLNAEIGRQRLSAILASTPDPVLVTDQQNRLLLANPAAWRALGLGVEWQEGKPIDELVSQKELLALLDGKNEDKRSDEIVLADKRVYYATASSVIAEGHRVGRVCVLRDITSFKELDSLKSEFVATVSHDLRSPLTLVRGYATMLEIVGELNEQQTGYVRNIINGVESMGQLVNNLLDLGRIETGVGLKLEMVSVQDVVERVINTLQIQAAQRRIQLTSDTSQQTVPLIEADPALLQQALHNLVDNAIKYSERGDQVHVKTEVRQNRMMFIVSDDGIGIPPLDQPRVFEKFYRGAQTGTKRLRGTGLGLTIVKSIADRHGGEVWLESQLGRGSTFYLAIPIQASHKQK
jgi:PAS domain S-box-containing protein